MEFTAEQLYYIALDHAGATNNVTSQCVCVSACSFPFLQRKHLGVNVAPWHAAVIADMFTPAVFVCAGMATQLTYQSQSLTNLQLQC